MAVLNEADINGRFLLKETTGSIPRSEHEIEDLTFTVDYQVQLETEEPSHGVFPTLGKPPECFMKHYSPVAAYP